MTAYADYNFYQSEYLSGKAAVIPSEAFGHYAKKASAHINQHTFGDIGENVPEAIKLCCCELAELFYKSESSPTADGLVNEKVGDFSRSYESGTTAIKELPRQISGIIRSWLADTGLLYHGGKLC